VACKTENGAVIKYWGKLYHPAPAEAAFAIKSAINDTKNKKALLYNKFSSMKLIKE
jgi:hypothetical protein